MASPSLFSDRFLLVDVLSAALDAGTAVGVILVYFMFVSFFLLLTVYISYFCVCV
jgi:hypothetical protein